MKFAGAFRLRRASPTDNNLNESVRNIMAEMGFSHSPPGAEGSRRVILPQCGEAKCCAVGIGRVPFHQRIERLGHTGIIGVFRRGAVLRNPGEQLGVAP